MRYDARIRRVAGNLSVPQMVLLSIQEARGFPDMFAHGAALAARPVEAGTLCDRIEAAVRRASVGMDRERRDDLVRRAQRGGLFLAHLFTECNASLARSQRERELEGCVLALLLRAAESGGAAEHASGEHDPARWRRAADEYRRRLAEALGAVRLIEREYFGGASILYPGAEAALIEQIVGIERLIGFVGGAAGGVGGPRRSARRAGRYGPARKINAGPGRGAVRGASPGADVSAPGPDVDPGPRRGDPRVTPGAWRRARRWVAIARAKAHDALGEEAATVAQLDSIIGAGESEEGCARSAGPGSTPRR